MINALDFMKTVFIAAGIKPLLWCRTIFANYAKHGVRGMPNLATPGELFSFRWRSTRSTLKTFWVYRVQEVLLSEFQGTTGDDVTRAYLLHSGHLNYD